MNTEYFNNSVGFKPILSKLIALTNENMMGLSNEMICFRFPFAKWKFYVYEHDLLFHRSNICKVGDAGANDDVDDATAASAAITIVLRPMFKLTTRAGWNNLNFIHEMKAHQKRQKTNTI